MWFAIFNIYPAIYSFWISFQDYHLLGEAKCVGRQNYLKVFRTPSFHCPQKHRHLRPGHRDRTDAIGALCWRCWSTRNCSFMKFFRLVYYFPVISSWVVVSLIFTFLFNSEGLINFLLVDVIRVMVSPLPGFPNPGGPSLQFARWASGKGPAG